MKLIDSYIHQADILIKENNIEELQNTYNDLINTKEQLPFDLAVLFQKLYLKACLYGNKNTINWFINIYKNEMCPISKIHQKSTINYSKHLIRKRNNDELFKWFNRVIQ